MLALPFSSFRSHPLLAEPVAIKLDFFFPFDSFLTHSTPSFKTAACLSAPFRVQMSDANKKQGELLVGVAVALASRLSPPTSIPAFL